MAAKKLKLKPVPPAPVIRVAVRDLFRNGNAFVILGKCHSAARHAGWKPEEWEAFNTKAKSGDYDHLLQTVMSRFDELDEEEGES